MIMGGDSFPEGRGFESEHHILDGHFFTYICCKHCSLFEKTKMKEKEAGIGPFFKKNFTYRGTHLNEKTITIDKV